MKTPKKISLNPVSHTSIPISLYFKETEQKLASGTAFMYERNGKNYLVTNWHNLTGLDPNTKKQIGNHGGKPDKLLFTILTQEKPFMIWENFSIDLYDEGQNPDWLIHPIYKESVDVVAIEILHNKEFEGIFKPINQIKFDEFEPWVSDDVFILGFPYNIRGGGALPIWKRGSIASEPDIDYDDLPKVIVDSASRPGMSGSPVIFKRTGVHNAENGKLTIDSSIGTIKNFLGVYSGRIRGKSEFEAQLGIVWKKVVIDQIIDGNLKDGIF